MDLVKIPGIGPKKEKELSSIGVFTVEDLAKRSFWDDRGESHFGRNGWGRLVRGARMAIGRRIIRDVSKIAQDEIIIETDKTYSDKELIKKSVASLLHSHDYWFLTSVEERMSSYRVVVFPVESNKHYFTKYIIPNAESLLEHVRKKGEEIKAFTEKDTARDMDDSLMNYVKGLISREEEVKDFAKSMQLNSLCEYFEEYGGVASVDVLLSWAQLFGIADIEVLKPNGERLTTTGFHLAYFGDVGTGKTYSSIDFVMGNEKLGLEPHGIPGRYRYCGGITPYMFLHMGQYYEGKRMVFLVPEFNDWFFHERGMVERLKLAMEQKTLKYESARETIGPYVFTSFFNANYNVKVKKKGYRLTVPDPNFNAIEDRCFCRLHKMTKQRFLDIIDSIEKHALGMRKEMKITPDQIRDHATLLYSINTGLIKDYKPSKVQFLEEQIRDVTSATKIFAEEYVEESRLIHASPRSIYKCLQLSSALSLPFYFTAKAIETPSHRILLVEDRALRMAVEIMLEDLTVRMLEDTSPEEVKETVLPRLFDS
ncbi:MAG: hypothetical protein QMD78_04550 [Methanocellales archaeon]|nr:hypothetical protein [Methanocellales archaeon]